MPTLPKLPLIKVVPLWKAQQILCTKGDRGYFQSVISIGYNTFEKEPEGFYSFPRPKLRMNVNDVTFPEDEGAATRKDIEDLVAFVPQITGPCLIHCHAGMSRSPAAMLIYYAARLGPRHHKDAIDLWYGHERSGTPNYLMVAWADHIIGFDGKLYARYLETADRDKYEIIRNLYDRLKSP